MAFTNTMKGYIFKYEPRIAVGCGSVLIICGLSALIIGDIYSSIGYTLMGISIITSNYIKRKLMLVCSVVTMGLALWILIFKPFSNDEEDTARREAGVQQEVMNQAAKPNNGKSDTSKEKGSKPADIPAYISQGGSPLDGRNLIIPPELQDDPTIQQMMKVMNSDSFQKQLKEQAPQTSKEYIDLMVAHGATGLAEIDIDKGMAYSYDFMAQKYQAENPGKDPAEEDKAMAKRFGEVLKESGLIKGMEELTTDRKNVIWINARFKGDEAAFNEWWGDVVAIYESEDSASTDSGLPHGELFDILSDETTLDIPVSEPEQGSSDRARSEMWEESTISNADDRGVTPPEVQPEKIVTSVSPELPTLPAKHELETALRERFSSERYERAIATLDRYGPEEGLRQLRENDPEIAKQIEDSRNGVENSRRAGVEQHRDRLSEEENSR